MRAFQARRLAVSLIVFGVVHAYVESHWRWPIQSWILDAGKAAGCQVVEMGAIVNSPYGPFYGDDVRTRVWNWAYRTAGWGSAVAIAYAAAMAAYGLCAGPLGRTRVFGYRGPTRCGRCSYALHGLRQPVCPECGTRI
jgi:hypothetical protein